MKRFFQRIKNRTLGKQQAVKPKLAICKNQAKEVEFKYYIPAENEPSIFDEDPCKISQNWYRWWLLKNPSKPYPLMLEEAEKVKHRLLTEPFRDVDSLPVPNIFVDPPIALSLKWVIWNAYIKGISMQESHLSGLVYLTR